MKWTPVPTTEVLGYRLDRQKHAILARVLRSVSYMAWNIAPGSRICGRIKGIQSTRSKVRLGHSASAQVLDSIGVRAIVGERAQCYRLMEHVHLRFQVIDGECDDYIEHPKRNGYQSLHTTILTPDGHPVEVQVRTRQMHACAERGAAAHWVYKRASRLAAVRTVGDRFESTSDYWRPTHG